SDVPSLAPGKGRVRNPYAFTIDAATEIVWRTLSAPPPPGATIPSKAFGPGTLGGSRCQCAATCAWPLRKRPRSAVTPSGPVLHPSSLAPPSHVRDDGLIVTVTPPSELSDAGVEFILRALEARMARGSKYVLVFDLSGSGTPTAVQRQLLAAHMKKN